MRTTFDRGGGEDKGETKEHRGFRGRKLRNLNVLDLRHISELNNETVMEVVRKCRNLSSLNLCLNWSINDSNGQKQRPSLRKAGMSTKYGLPSSQSDRQIVT
ncbi:F-box/LRR-repeat protein 17, partial [Dissostichus eleginoides]